MGGRVKNKEQKKIIDIVSLKVSENGVICVFVVHFRSSDTFKSLQTGLTVNIRVSTKTYDWQSFYPA